MADLGSVRWKSHGKLRGAVLLFVGTLFLASTGRADEVLSKGTALRGTVVGISAAGVQFTGEYGEGEIAIPWENIENLRTDGSMQILAGDAKEVDGPILGYSDGKLRVGAAEDTAAEVAVSEIVVGVPIGVDGLSWQDRSRSYWRYWDGSFDLGLNLAQATVDTFGFLSGIQALRTTDIHRLGLGASYRYGTQKKEGESKERLQDEWRGLIRGERDLSPVVYGFLSGEGQYDSIQRLSIRGIPKAGLGYVLWERELDAKRRDFLQAEAGGAWIYERFFGGDDNDYFGIAFAALAGYYLPRDARFDFRVDYLPAVDDWANDYLLRAEAGLGVPVMSAVSAKLALLNQYDNTPAEDTDRNSLFLTFGFSVGF